MTTQPTLVRRPADIDPTDWARMSWHARLRAHNRTASRPLDRSGIAYHSTPEQYVLQVEALIGAGWRTLDDVARELGRVPSTVARQLSAAGRHDLRKLLRSGGVR